MKSRIRRINATRKDAISLFPILRPVLRSTGVDYCVGGAVAMSTMGYSRATEDLDVFFNHEDTNKVLSALRRAGIVFATIAEPYHYAIFPDVSNPDHRIDLLFTSDDLEMDAVTYPDSGIVEGMEIEVFPRTLLVAAKARSGREKDRNDVVRMYERGVFEVDEIVKVLKHYDEPKPSKLLRQLLTPRK